MPAAHDPRSTLELDDVTILAQRGDLEDRRQLFAGQRPAGALGHPLPVDRRNERLPVLTHELVGRPAGELRVGAIHARDGAIQGERQDRVAGVVEEAPVPLLAVPEGLFREPALGDVTVDALVADGAAPRVPEQARPALEGHDTPVPPDRLQSEDLWQLLSREHPAHALLTERERSGRDQLTDVAADQRLPRPLERLLRRAVDADDRAVQGGGDDEVARVLEQGAKASLAFAQARLGPPAPRAPALEGFDAPSQCLDLRHERRSGHLRIPVTVDVSLGRTERCSGSCAEGSAELLEGQRGGVFVRDPCAIINP